MALQTPIVTVDAKQGNVAYVHPLSINSATSMPDSCKSKRLSPERAQALQAAASALVPFLHAYTGSLVDRKCPRSVAYLFLSYPEALEAGKYPTMRFYLQSAESAARTNPLYDHHLKSLVDTYHPATQFVVALSIWDTTDAIYHKWEGSLDMLCSIEGVQETDQYNLAVLLDNKDNVVPIGQQKPAELWTLGERSIQSDRLNPYASTAAAVASSRSTMPSESKLYAPVVQWLQSEIKLYAQTETTVRVQLARERVITAKHSSGDLWYVQGKTAKGGMILASWDPMVHKLVLTVYTSGLSKPDVLFREVDRTQVFPKWTAHWHKSCRNDIARWHRQFERNLRGWNSVPLLTFQSTLLRLTTQIEWSSKDTALVQSMITDGCAYALYRLFQGFPAETLFLSLYGGKIPEPPSTSLNDITDQLAGSMPAVQSAMSTYSTLFQHLPSITSSATNRATSGSDDLSRAKDVIDEKDIQLPSLNPLEAVDDHVRGLTSELGLDKEPIVFPKPPPFMGLFNNWQWVQENQTYLDPNSWNGTLSVVEKRHPYRGIAFAPQFSKAARQFAQRCRDVYQLQWMADAVTMCCYKGILAVVLKASAASVWDAQAYSLESVLGNLSWLVCRLGGPDHPRSEALMIRMSYYRQRFASSSQPRKSDYFAARRGRLAGHSVGYRLDNSDSCETDSSCPHMESMVLPSTDATRELLEQTIQRLSLSASDSSTSSFAASTTTMSELRQPMKQTKDTISVDQEKLGQLLYSVESNDDNEEDATRTEIPTKRSRPRSRVPRASEPASQMALLPTTTESMTSNHTSTLPEDPVVGYCGWSGCPSRLSKPLRTVDPRMETKCTGGCWTRYHYPGCWRAVSQRNKEWLTTVNYPCPTPDCAASWREIHLFESGGGIHDSPSRMLLSILVSSSVPRLHAPLAATKKFRGSSAADSRAVSPSASTVKSVPVPARSSSEHKEPGRVFGPPASDAPPIGSVESPKPDIQSEKEREKEEAEERKRKEEQDKRALSEVVNRLQRPTQQLTSLKTLGTVIKSSKETDVVLDKSKRKPPKRMTLSELNERVEWDQRDRASVAVVANRPVPLLPCSWPTLSTHVDTKHVAAVAASVNPAPEGHPPPLHPVLVPIPSSPSTLVTSSTTSITTPSNLTQATRLSSDARPFIPKSMTTSNNIVSAGSSCRVRLKTFVSPFTT